MEDAMYNSSREGMPVTGQQGYWEFWEFWEFWEIPNSQYPQKINLGIWEIPKLGILGIW